ncbi:hypothetical protein OHA72_15165 [Dactylosporangium sp. NBC_01737]|uniref:hypothetical protein n=1 Tax=Dactylosporangium sp. NBC_01737 TaxID=2975959 RepID=UPI002E16182B|nr:hypothetical protein OHA72_15165 [Dactylosporangium sp. NBC_01737]
MRDWIAVIITVLGVLLVLAGATLILLRALPARTPAPAAAADPSADTSVAPEPVPVTTRIAGAWKEPTAADRLIFWGIILLVLAAIAAGAITFNLGAAGGSVPATR